MTLGKLIVSDVQACKSILTETIDDAIKVIFNIHHGLKRNQNMSVAIA
eukprot:CAMPEP_0176326006 /NCGR_PEP_ID=MMETSP0121_2-20121125/73706_1 /TAXON_ID=160619 /ORGANISM="Kryptoperidinium foliaceum, Strain CCMP 1326" /LENGTH=47 /DNA_ID= /DNA_START= /DNA_END= /DNA_ORIENTATION=